MVEAPTTTALGAAKNTQSEPSEIREEEARPASPSPIAPTSFFRQISEEEKHDALAVSMEPRHGDLHYTDEAIFTDLPLDICRLILHRLHAFDILRFPLVCRPWADVYAEKRRLQPGAPTLLTSPSEGGWEIEHDYLQGLFFINNIMSREAFLVEVEGLRYRSWVGGKDEWLVTLVRASYYVVELLNPITGECIPLPNDLPPGPGSSLERVQLCRTPTEVAHGGYFAIAISDNMLSYTMAKSSHWITLENPVARWMNYSDAIMHGSKIIAICLNGDLWSWDLEEGGRNPKLLLSSCVNFEGWRQFDLILAPSLKDNILVISPRGQDVPIRWGHRGSCRSNHWNFVVDGVVLHEVDIDAQSIEEVRDIGDRALFLGLNYPFYVPVLVPSGDLKKNHVYIADVSDDDVVAIDLSLDDLPSNVSLINYFGPDKPNQVPMWFRPAFS